MSFENKTTAELINLSLKNDTSCCHETQVAFIVASMCNKMRYKRGTGWHKLVDGTYTVDANAGNYMWLLPCQLIHQMMLKHVDKLYAEEQGTTCEVVAIEKLRRRIKRMDRLMSTHFSNKVHTIVKRILPLTMSTS